jgi:uncharacterized protein with HEPN domain
MGLKLNGTHELLAYADINLLGDNIDNIKKDTETSFDVSMGVGLEIFVEETKYMLLSRHQNVCQYPDIKKQIVWKCVTVQISGDDSNESKFDSGGN